MELIDILPIIFGVVLLAICVLLFIYLKMSVKDKNIKVNESNNKNIKQVVKKDNQYTKLSVFNFMEFDKIEDNMIVQKNGQRYLMAIECEGINYDLMSSVEKVAVEQGFIQFLNTLRHPIQLYTQTRTINISSSIENYNKRVNIIRDELVKKQNQYNKMIQTGAYDKKDLQDIKMDIARQQNLYDYSKDIVANIENLSANKNVLRKHYYIIIPYYSGDLGNEITDEEEKKNMVFSELYTRAQSIMRTLFACSMKCKVMNSNELAELLYVAYNRDDSEIYGIEKALNSGYGELYSTAPDILDKKMEALNQKIQEDAMKLAIETVDTVKSQKQKIIEKKEKNFDQLVKELAAVVIKENKNYIGKEIANEAVAKINQKNTEEKEVVKNAKEEKTKTRRTRKNA